MWMFPLVSTNLTLSMDIMVISVEIVSLYIVYHKVNKGKMITYPKFSTMNKMKYISCFTKLGWCFSPLLSSLAFSPCLKMGPKSNWL